MQPLLDLFHQIGGTVLVPVVIIMLAIAFVLTIKYIASRYKKIPPGRVGIFYGRSYRWPDGTTRGYLIVTGGGRVLMPLFENYLEVPTTAFQVMINEQNIPNKDNVKLTVPGVATCKISTDPADLNRAIDALIDKMGQDDIRKGTDHTALEEFVLNILKGHLRSIIGKLDINELLRNRDEFNKRVMNESEEELKKFGIDLMNLVIQDIRDDQQYIDALGKKAVATAKADAEIEVSNAEKAQKTVQAQNQVAIADAEKDRDLRKAEFKRVTATAQAEADMAGAIATAAQEQRLKVAEAERDAAERTAQVKVQEQEEFRKKAELKATIVAMAAATKEKTIIDAEAAKEKRIIDADAEAEFQKRTAQANRDAATLKGEGEANAKKAVLIAEAEGNAASERATLVARAEGTKQLNEALAQMSEAAKLILILDRLPGLLDKGGDAGAKILQSMFGPAAAAIGQIDTISIVDVGGSGNGVGRVSGMVTETVFNLLAQLKARGVDLKSVLGTLGINTDGLDALLKGIAPANAAHTLTEVPPAK